MHLDLDMMGQRGQRWGFTLIKVGPGSPGAGGAGGGSLDGQTGKSGFMESPTWGSSGSLFKVFFAKKAGHARGSFRLLLC